MSATGMADSMEGPRGISLIADNAAPSGYIPTEFGAAILAGAAQLAILSWNGTTV